MKDFMEKLFSSQYFGVVLFSVIGVLALLFIIVLIMAIKDAKKNKRAQEFTEETDKAEKMADVAFASFNDTPIKAEVDPVKEEKHEDVVEFKTPTNDTFADIKVDAPTEFIDNNNKSAFPDLDISEPVASDLKTDNSIGSTSEAETSNLKVVEEKKEDTVEEPVLKPQQPEQFSSIYVTHDNTKSTNSNVMPDIADIPMPTPIKVVSSTSIEDVKRTDDNNVQEKDVSKTSEEYTLK